MPVEFAKIKEPVGAGSSSAGSHRPIKNLTDDVKVIQETLNTLKVEDGGASPKLPLSGAISGASDATVTAIRAFQRLHFGWEDGVVDPGNKTESKMRELLKLHGPRIEPPKPVVPKPVIPSVSPSRIGTREQPPGEKFLLVEVPDNRSKEDLDFSARSVRAGMVASARVGVAMLEPTLLLEAELAREMIVGGSTAMTLFNAWTSNTTVSERNFPDLDTAVESTPGFLDGIRDIERRIKANLREQFRLGEIDYHDLVTGTGPTRRWSDTIAATEAGKATGRMLPSLEPPSVSLSLVDDRVAKICIGSFQGVRVFLTRFSANLAESEFEATLVYELLDHFGVDDDDCEVATRGIHGTPGQVAMWVLQHHHRPGHIPWITLVRVFRSISGSLV